MAGLYSGKKGVPTGVSYKQRRNVIATKDGWVLRTQRSGGKYRDEILVARKGAGYHGYKPEIIEIYTDPEKPTNNVLSKLIVRYNEPVNEYNGGAGANTVMTITINRPGGGTVTATSNGTVSGANNNVEFTFTPNVTGVWTVPTQTFQTRLYSLNGTGTAEAANTVIGTAATFTVV